MCYKIYSGLAVGLLATVGNPRRGGQLGPGGRGQGARSTRSCDSIAPTPATVLASAELDAFPDWVGSSGSAEVMVGANGSRVVDVTVDLPQGGEGYREIWLISTDTSQLVSLGIVDGATGTFTIPAGLDLSRYDLVDISEEPFDGDPTHSGDSIVRGQLS